MEHSIQWYLTQWGLWQRLGASPIPRYVSSSYVVFAQNVEQSRHNLSPNITEDECLRIDGHIARLSQRDRIKATIVFLYYVRNLSVEAIANILRISREAARQLRLQAESWLDCAVIESA